MANQNRLENHMEAIEALEGIVRQEEENQIIESIEGAIQSSRDNPGELYRTVFLNLTQQLGPNMRALLIDVLLNNQTLLDLQDEASTDLDDFLQKLTRKYGAMVKKGYMNLFESDDWRYINSSVRRNERGYRLETNILKWNGDEVTISSEIHDVLNMVSHLVKNINNQFDAEQIQQYSEPLSQYLKTVKEEIDELEKSLEEETD